ncbi:hypothetical protein FQN50_005211 [Emmonsiellopsis sp. PD_5]|nr:hypothetical protein FQN50_005211 [Emmonsiellopsis sp. PD_5]
MGHCLTKEDHSAWLDEPKRNEIMSFNPESQQVFLMDPSLKNPVGVGPGQATTWKQQCRHGFFKEEAAKPDVPSQQWAVQFEIREKSKKRRLPASFNDDVGNTKSPRCDTVPEQQTPAAMPSDVEMDDLNVNDPSHIPHETGPAPDLPVEPSPDTGAAPGPK